MTVGPGSVLARAPQVVWRSSGETLLALAHRGDELMTLSASGHALWAALDQPRTTTEVVEELARTYDVPVPQMTSDLTPFVAELHQRHLLLVDGLLPG